MRTTCASLRADAARAVNRACELWLRRESGKQGILLTRASEGVGLAGVLIAVVSSVTCDRSSARLGPGAVGRERR
jgi:hypothetical protein